jgi:hypothetical protein
MGLKLLRLVLPIPVVAVAIWRLGVVEGIWAQAVGAVVLSVLLAAYWLRMLRV